MKDTLLPQEDASAFEAVESQLEWGLKANAKLQRALNPTAAASAELHAAGVVASAISNLYPFDIRDIAAAAIPLLRDVQLADAALAASQTTDGPLSTDRLVLAGLEPDEFVESYLDSDEFDEFWEVLLAATSYEPVLADDDERDASEVKADRMLDAGYGLIYSAWLLSRWGEVQESISEALWGDVTVQRAVLQKVHRLCRAYYDAVWSVLIERAAPTA